MPAASIALMPRAGAVDLRPVFDANSGETDAKL